MMKWNAKTPIQWDLDNLFMVNATAAENPRKMHQTEWEIDGDGGIDSASFFLLGGVDCNGGSSSDLGLTSLSKSSKSASNNSLSIEETDTPKFNLEAFEIVPEDFDNGKEFAKAEPTGGSPTLEDSIGSGEPLLSLKLGKRMYYEDVSAGSKSKNSSFPVLRASFATSGKRSRSNRQSAQALLCQVEGCGLDLSSAKAYHRKHRVCENHSKSPKVVVGGKERRFCQQCSRLHGLSEFDEKKRSCRRRLSDHNARRRKPQPQAVQLNAARLSSSLYVRKQPWSLFWNGVPFVHTNPSENFTLEGTYGFKSTQMKGDASKSAKAGATNGLLHLRSNQPPNLIPACSHDSNGFLPSKAKGTMAEVLDQGPEDSMLYFNLGAKPDCHRALSLLSKTSWGVCEPKQVSEHHPMGTSHSSMHRTVMPAMAQGSPFASSEYRHIGKQLAEFQAHPSSFQHDEGNCTQ